MDKQTIKKLTEKLARRFPEIAEVKPQVKKMHPPQGNHHDMTKNTLLIYKTTAMGPGGKTVPRIIRVVISPDGRILKTTTSR